MPKITLINRANGRKEQFEPVDAREILATPDSQYDIDEESRKLIGMQFDANVQRENGLNVPQLQGGDVELNTGLSIEKYGRSQVVKAVPEDSSIGSTADRPMSTTGRPLNEQQQRKEQAGQAKAIREQAKAEGRSQGSEKSNTPEKVAARQAERAGEQTLESEGEEKTGGAAMTKDELKAALDKEGIAYPSKASKDELVAIYDENFE